MAHSGLATAGCEVGPGKTESGNGRTRTSSIVPDPVVGELHGICVLGLLEVLVSVSTHVPPTAYVAAYQTNPEVLQGGDLSR